ncbi:MAG: adaptor protein MecA, partial [Clostridiales bacterium]|nr:adaptor protein MecA [Clostridiales bacterium]
IKFLYMGILYRMGTFVYNVREQILQLNDITTKGWNKMKIEKVNENQIFCTFTREDLASRKIRLSELAYGTEKAKSLFGEIIRRASYECGFEVDDLPIMIEAIPMSGESMAVLITKVEFPDELDARFSDFSSFAGEDAMFEDLLEEKDTQTSGADDIIDYFKRFRKKQETAEDETQGQSRLNPDSEAQDLIQIFEFDGINQVESFACMVGGYYKGENSLYRLDAQNGESYVLTLHKQDHTPEEFNRISNLASEYGHTRRYSPVAGAYYREHGKLMLKDRAVQSLKEMLLS